MLRKTRTNYKAKPKEQTINPKVLEEIKAFEQNVDVPRKQMLDSDHGTKKNLQEKSDNLSMREQIPSEKSADLCDLPQSIYEELEKDASIKSIATSKSELQELYKVLCKEGLDQEAALREMRGYVQSGPSQRLLETVGSDLALSEVSHGSSQKCGCGHGKETHYGGEKGYCNSKDCSCLEFI